MASGKSSVAQAVAERLTKSVHLRGDVFRRMIVSGQAEMTFELSAEAQHQLAVETAKRYVDAVFIQQTTSDDQLHNHGSIVVNLTDREKLAGGNR